MSKNRVIFHMDGDAFFVGCEVAKNPKLKGLPVVTGQERGIVGLVGGSGRIRSIKININNESRIKKHSIYRWSESLHGDEKK